MRSATPALPAINTLAWFQLLNTNLQIYSKNQTVAQHYGAK